MCLWWTGLLWPNVDLSLLFFDGLVYWDRDCALSICSVDRLVYWDPACLTWVFIVGVSPACGSEYWSIVTKCRFVPISLWWTGLLRSWLRLVPVFRWWTGLLRPCMLDLGLHCHGPFDWSTGWGIPRMWLWIFQWSMHFQEINPFHALLQGDHSLPDISSGLDLLRLSYLLRRFVLSSLRVVYVPISWFPFNPCLLSGLLFEEGVREQVNSLLWYLYFFIWLMLMMSDVHWSL